MDIGILIIYVIFLMIDLMIIYKPIPILAFPMMSFFLYIGVTEFLPLTSSQLPLNPITTAFFLIVSGLGIFVNGLDLRK